MTDSGQDSLTWSTRPLCRRYILATFRTAILRWCDGEGSVDHGVHWAFAWLSDGEGEALGAWAARGSDNEPPVAADLNARGVEKIWHLAAAEGPHHSTRFDPWKPNSLEDLRHGAKTLPTAFADQVSETLTRSILRHGRFKSESDALAFVGAALLRAERRLDRERRLRLRPPAPLMLPSPSFAAGGAVG